METEIASKNYVFSARISSGNAKAPLDSEQRSFGIDLHSFVRTHLLSARTTFSAGSATYCLSDRMGACQAGPPSRHAASLLGTFTAGAQGMTSVRQRDQSALANKHVEQAGWFMLTIHCHLAFGFWPKSLDGCHGRCYCMAQHCPHIYIYIYIYHEDCVVLWKFCYRCFVLPGRS